MTKVQQIVDKETGEILTQHQLKPNSNFVQFYRNEMHGIRDLIKAEPKAASLFMFLAEKMDQENALIVSKETLAEVMQVSVRTVTRQIAVLKEKGFIQILKSGVTNIYLINANIAWTTDGDRKAFAKFRANVFVSKSEQEYNVRAKKYKQLDLIPRTEKAEIEAKKLDQQLPKKANTTEERRTKI